VLHYLTDKHPEVHALLVGSRIERDREILLRFPNAVTPGHQDAVDAARAYAAVASTEAETLSCLLLFLGPSLQSQAIMHVKGSIFWDALFEQHESWKEAQVPVLLKELRQLGPQQTPKWLTYAVKVFSLARGVRLRLTCRPAIWGSADTHGRQTPK
jgi:hypothetical protein